MWEFFRKGCLQTSKEESSYAAHWGLAIPWQVKAGVVAYGTSECLGAGFVQLPFIITTTRGFCSVSLPSARPHLSVRCWGSEGLAGLKQAVGPLCWDTGSRSPLGCGCMVLTSSRSGGVKGLGMSCLSWLHRVMGPWVMVPWRDQCHCCGHPERGGSSIEKLRPCTGEGGVAAMVLRAPQELPWFPRQEWEGWHLSTSCRFTRAPAEVWLRPRTSGWMHGCSLHWWIGVLLPAWPGSKVPPKCPELPPCHGTPQ